MIRVSVRPSGTLEPGWTIRTAEVRGKGTGMILTPIRQFGDMIVYSRARGHETWIPRYVVIQDSTGRALEEFHQARSAIRWARDNANG